MEKKLSDSEFRNIKAKCEGKYFPDWLPIEAKCKDIGYDYSCIVVPINEPPCKTCEFWKPRKSDLWEGHYYRICWAKEMYFDFSCYRSSEK
jgi:hypothetical protein